MKSLKKIISFACILAVLAITNCKLLKKQGYAYKPLSENCDSLSIFIHNNWFYLEKDKIYQANPDFFTQFNLEGKYAKCLTKINIAQLQILLGKPHRNSSNVLIYYLTKGCNSEDKIHCNAISFPFDRNGFLAEPYIGDSE